MPPKPCCALAPQVPWLRRRMRGLPGCVVAIAAVASAATFCAGSHRSPSAWLSTGNPNRPFTAAVQRAAGAQSSSAKDDLFAALRESDSGAAETSSQATNINRLIDVLADSSSGRKFSEELADGDWALVFTRNADGSPALQKLSRTKPGGTFANFDVSQSRFENVVKLLGESCSLSATVTYAQDAEEPSRISCDITDAGLELFGLRIPLPLRAEGGWLDFLYLDETMRITRGNKGGVFVHVRPDKIKEIFGR
mmetsp:Transcript_9487/g.19166  ORF Transcript_9487/g.19166 Transcript_9487/m.19166 type:complete len:252 (-) Transcript_9487:127-882(-)